MILKTMKNIRDSDSDCSIFDHEAEYNRFPEERDDETYWYTIEEDWLYRYINVESYRSASGTTQLKLILFLSIFVKTYSKGSMYSNAGCGKCFGGF